MFTFGGSSREDRAKGEESAEEREEDGEFGRHDGAWFLVLMMMLLLRVQQ